jgi:hypothetical protein
VCVETRARREFEALLRQALAVDPDARPEWRLANLVMQRRARQRTSAVGCFVGVGIAESSATENSFETLRAQA